MLSFLFCLCIVFLTSFSCLSLFSCRTVYFLNSISLNSLSDSSQILVFFGGVLFPWLSWSLWIIVSVYSRKEASLDYLDRFYPLGKSGNQFYGYRPGTWACSNGPGPVPTCTDKDPGYRGRKWSRCIDYWVGPASACLAFGPVLGCSRNLALWELTWNLRIWGLALS